MAAATHADKSAKPSAAEIRAAHRGARFGQRGASCSTPDGVGCAPSLLKRLQEEADQAHPEGVAELARGGRGRPKTGAPSAAMATRSKLAALGRQLRASSPLVGQGVPKTVSGAPAAALPPMAFAAVDTVECAPRRAPRALRAQGATC